MVVWGYTEKTIQNAPFSTELLENQAWWGLYKIFGENFPENAKNRGMRGTNFSIDPSQRRKSKLRLTFGIWKQTFFPYAPGKIRKASYP